MDKQNRYEKYNKRKKVKKIKWYISVIVLLSIVVLYFLYQYYQLNLENLELTRKNALMNISSAECKEGVYEIVSNSFKGFINNEKYSIFVTFLIFLGILYLIQIGISAMLDIVELIAFGFVSIRGIGRLPSKIKEYFKRRNERRLK